MKKFGRWKIIKALHNFGASDNVFLLIMAVLVGIAGGLGAAVFRLLIDVFTNNLVPIGAGTHLFVFVPMIGGIIAGVVIYVYAKEAKGHGVPEVMEAVAIKGGRIRPRVAAAKTVASAACLGSGGSAGREGPIVQIGATLGSTIGQFFNLSERRIKVLVGCGAAAGIAAIFNAPIAGVLFALEIILLGDFAINTFSPIVISSVTASVVTHLLYPNNPLFQVPAYTLVSPIEIVFYLGLGALAGVVAVFFIKFLYKSEDFFDMINLPDYVKPAIGGFLLGCVAFFFPQIMADGYNTISLVLIVGLPLVILVVLVFIKILATSLTLGSGSSGGVFAPSLFIGAMMGGAFGILVTFVIPSHTGALGAYALVGMAALVAGTTHAVLTSIILIFEITNNYMIILPLMVASVTAALVSKKLHSNSIYTEKTERKGIHLVSGRAVDSIESIQVKDVMIRPRRVDPDMKITSVNQKMNEWRLKGMPVTDKDHILLGLVTKEDVREALIEGKEDLAVQKIMKKNPMTCVPDETLDKALKKIGVMDLAIIPVIRSEADPHLVGILKRVDVINTYNTAVVRTLGKKK